MTVALVYRWLNKTKAMLIGDEEVIWAVLSVSGVSIVWRKAEYSFLLWRRKASKLRSEIEVLFLTLERKLFQSNSKILELLSICGLNDSYKALLLAD